MNADNFVRAETDRMFGDLQRDAGAPNRFRHNRAPASIDEQTVIRMNRDTLYSFAVVNLAGGARLTLPDAGGRYLSAMVVSNDHLVPAILHDAGVHRLDQASVGTQFALVAARILVDPADPTDVAAVVAMQDEISISAGADEPFTSPDYDTASLDVTRNAFLQLAAGMRGFDRTFGTREEVDPVRHLIGAAAGWGRASVHRGCVRRCRPRPRHRGLRADPRGCARRCVLVDLGLQRQGLLREESARPL